MRGEGKRFWRYGEVGKDRKQERGGEKEKERERERESGGGGRERDREAGREDRKGVG